MIFYRPPADDQIACKVQGWLVTFFVMSGVYLTAAIATHLRMTITHRATYKLTKCKFGLTCCAVYGLAAIDATLPLSYYKELGNMCWIDNERKFKFTFHCCFLLFIKIYHSLHVP